MNGNSTECFEIVGKYGKFHLFCLDTINATLYESGKYKGSCNNRHSVYCTLYGERLHLVEDDQHYNICISTHIVEDHSVVYSSIDNYYEEYENTHKNTNIDIRCTWYPTIGTIFLIIFLCLIVIYGPFCICLCIYGCFSVLQGKIKNDKSKEYIDLDGSLELDDLTSSSTDGKEIEV